MAIKQLGKTVTSMGMSQRASERASFCYVLEFRLVSKNLFLNLSKLW